MNEKVYSPEKWAKVNQNNKYLMDDYLLELRSKKRRSSTLSQYGFDSRFLLCYIHDELDNRDLTSLSKKDIRRITLWLSETRVVSNARFNRVMALLRGAMEYAEDEDDYEYDKNVVRKVKNLPKKPVRKIHFLSDNQIHKIREYLLEKGMYRECVYLDLSYDSVGRIGEILQVQKHDLLTRRYTNIVDGKGGKPFPLLYHKNTLESLELYLNQRGEDNIDSLWVSKSPKGNVRELTDSALYSWCKMFNKVLNIVDDCEMDFTPHSFRHSGLENYKNGTHYMCIEMGRPDGFTIEELQILAHHDSVDTTKSYLKPNDNNVLEGMFGITLS